VLATGQLERALGHWPSTLTMAVGSFLAGASPEGGGAVAFPVFTKALDVPLVVARSFSLCIQAVGMSAASVVILLTRRPIEGRVVAISVAAAAAGFAAALVLLGDRGHPFWTRALPPAYVKVTFTFVLAAMAFVMFEALRAERYGVPRIRAWNARFTAGLALSAFAGGAIASLTGTGVNVLVFLFVVVMAGLHPRVRVPTSVIAMAAISVVGLLMLGVADGRLRVDLDGSGAVAAVAGEAAALGDASGTCSGSGSPRCRSSRGVLRSGPTSCTASRSAGSWGSSACSPSSRW